MIVYKTFSWFPMSLITTLVFKISHILAVIYFFFLKNVLDLTERFLPYLVLSEKIRKVVIQVILQNLGNFCKLAGAALLGGLGGGFSPPPLPTFLLSNQFLFSAKKCLYANKRNEDKPLSQKRVYSKHICILSLRIPKFCVLKIKNAEVCFEN